MVGHGRSARAEDGHVAPRSRSRRSWFFSSVSRISSSEMEG
jgi:hypothetical protein